MFCKVTIALFGAAIVSAGAINRCHGAAGTFSEDGNHVYLIGSKLPKGTALDIDLTNFTAKKLSLGVSGGARDLWRIVWERSRN
jgi:hypothetical protein